MHSVDISLILSQCLSFCAGLAFGWAPALLLLIGQALQELDGELETFQYPYPSVVLPWWRWAALIPKHLGCDWIDRSTWGSAIGSILSLCAMIIFTIAFFNADNILIFHMIWITVVTVTVLSIRAAKKWVTSRQELKATYDKLKGN